jgi:hypothetical protein
VRVFPAHATLSLGEAPHTGLPQTSMRAPKKTVDYDQVWMVEVFHYIRIVDSAYR